MPKAPPPHAGTLYLIHVLTHATRTHLDDALKPLDISSFQYTILSVLARNAGLSSARLSRRFYVTPQTMGETVQLLERKGLVERREDPTNKKALLLGLTDAGTAICATGDKIVSELERRIFEGRSSTDLRQLREILTSALVNLGDR